MKDQLEHDTLTSADDALLARLAAQRDTEAFAVLIRRYAPLMSAYARRILSGTNHVDDVVRDAFVVAWERLADVDDGTKVKSWLMRIVARQALDRLRAERHRVDVADVQVAPAANSSRARLRETREELIELSWALDQLPHAERDCWLLREMGEFSYDDIAVEMDITASTVRGLLARARRNLVVRMEQWR